MLRLMEATRNVQWISSSEAEQRFGFSRGYFAKLRAAGRGPRFIKISDSRQAHVRYSLADVEAWVASRTYENTSQYPTLGTVDTLNLRAQR